MTRRVRLLIHCDRVLAGLLVTLLVGASLAFGGAAWWARPAIAALTFLFVLTWLVRVLLEGSWRVLKSPLVLIGALGLLLALVQLVPLPDGMVGWLSPGSRSLHILGVMPDKMIDPSVDLPDPAAARAPISVDRSATLRWFGGGLVCLALFWSVGQYTDRLGRLYLVWGSVVGALLLNTTIAGVQLIGGAEGLYGGLEPGTGTLAPSLDDLLTSPTATVLRPVSFSPAQRGSAPGPQGWAIARPERPFLIGTLMGGPGGYLALAALGLPLGLALTLQLLAPRGSREAVWLRLRHSGKLGLVTLLCTLMAVSALLVGMLAGAALSVPFAVGLLLVGLPAAWRSGLRWAGVALTLGTAMLLGTGVFLGSHAQENVRDTRLLAERQALPRSVQVWSDSARMLRDFPAFGSGLGSFASVYPLYKTHDQSATVARSSVVQWSVEGGAVGFVLLVAAVFWCGWRLPVAVRRVGSADSTLAFGLIGTAVCFALFSVLHWSIELGAVALAASAVAGTYDRWLAGGTDLFVERV